VKLLGRRIGYKALETRLKQMWVKKGIINIIDLSNDYYLVTFSHETDHVAALTNGPWFIYDHYLTVKEWCPNFHPQSDTIRKVAVWVRISGLPIEYYDSKVLRHIGNKIGSTIKVDKNTLMQERGKYARICVEVDLTSPLLAMFMIKGRKYNVEYEGLHLLCTNCGRFGHYCEGCPEKNKTSVEQQKEGSASGGPNSEGVDLVGPWMVVQKPKRSRKAKEKEATPAEGGGRKGPAGINANSKNSGSRFASLMDDIPENLHENNVHAVIMDGPVDEGQMADEREIESIKKNQSFMGFMSNNVGGMTKGKRNERETNMEVRKNMRENQTVGNYPKNRNKRGNGGININGADWGIDRTVKEPKLATRGSASFKSKTASQVMKGVENVMDKMGVQVLEKLVVQADQTKFGPSQQLNEESNKNELLDGDVTRINTGQILVPFPNVPRPPNWKDAQSSSPNTNLELQDTECTKEVEVFVDANDQGSNGGYDSEMEVVVETPNLPQ
jgi:hypothetical protein